MSLLSRERKGGSLDRKGKLQLKNRIRLLTITRGKRRKPPERGWGRPVIGEALPFFRGRISLSTEEESNLPRGKRERGSPTELVSVVFPQLWISPSREGARKKNGVNRI